MHGSVKSIEKLISGGEGRGSRCLRAVGGDSGGLEEPVQNSDLGLDQGGRRVHASPFRLRWEYLALWMMGEG